MRPAIHPLLLDLSSCKEDRSRCRASGGVQGETPASAFWACLTPASELFAKMDYCHMQCRLSAQSGGSTSSPGTENI